MANSSSTEKKVSFFRGVRSEFKKITWPGKNEVIKQTITVVVVSAFTGLIIALLDAAIKYGVNLLTTF